MAGKISGIWMAGLQKKNKIVMKRSVAVADEDSFYQRSEEYTEKALEKKSVALGLYL